MAMRNIEHCQKVKV